MTVEDFFILCALNFVNFFFHSTSIPTIISLMFRYFFWTSLFFLLCAGVLLFTVTQLSPVGPQAIVSLILFFVGLFGTVFLLMTYLFFFGAELCEGKNLLEDNFQQSLRRGLFVALFVVSVVLLRLFNLWGWIETFLMASFFFVLELIFFIGDAKIPQQ